MLAANPKPSRSSPPIPAVGTCPDELVVKPEGAEGTGARAPETMTEAPGAAGENTNAGTNQIPAGMPTAAWRKSDKLGGTTEGSGMESGNPEQIERFAHKKAASGWPGSGFVKNQDTCGSSAATTGN